MRLKIFTSISCLFLGSFAGQAAIKMQDIHGGVAYLEKQNKRDAKHFSKILAVGPMARDMVSNLRFYGLVTPFVDEKGQRQYVKDTPINAFGKLSLILFPSPAGMLNTVSNAISNFGGHVTKAETVVDLLKFVDKAREVKNLDKNALNSWKDKIVGTLDLTGGRSTVKRMVKTLLNSIQGSVALEGEFYPEYLTEGFISLFFQQRFDTLEDVQELVYHLYGASLEKKEWNPEAWDPETIQPLTQEMLDAILVKKLPLSKSDLFTLHCAGTFNLNFPYNEEEPPIDNALTSFYDRTTDTINDAKHFSDCTETVIRHICNMFFPRKGQTFDVLRLPDSPNFKNLRIFFDKQDVKNANNSSSYFRTLWNTVVGDLGEGVVYTIEGKAGLEVGFDNIIHVFEKIFNLDLGKPQDPDNAETWLIESFKMIFKTLNPAYTCDIRFNEVSLQLTKLIGSMSVIVYHKEEEQFSFKASATGEHSCIDTFALSQKESEQVEKLKTYAAVYEQNLLPSKDLFGLLLHMQSPETKKEISYPFYKLIVKNLSQGNKKRIAWLRQLVSVLKKEKKFLKKSVNLKIFLEQIFKNVLQDISSDYLFRTSEFSDILLNLYEHDSFQPILREKMLKYCEESNPMRKNSFISGFSPGKLEGRLHPLYHEMIEKSMLCLQRAIKEDMAKNRFARATCLLLNLSNAEIFLPKENLEAFFSCLPFVKLDAAIFLDLDGSEKIKKIKEILKEQPLARDIFRNNPSPLVRKIAEEQFGLTSDTEEAEAMEQESPVLASWCA
jgi:hypothetical protein